MIIDYDKTILLFENVEAFNIDSVSEGKVIQNIFMDSSIFQSFLHSFNDVYKVDNGEFLLVLYCRKAFSDKDTLRHSQVAAISVYSFRKDFIFHQFFVKGADSVFEQIVELSSKTYILASKPITDLATYYLADKKEFSLLFVDRNLAKRPYTSGGKDLLQEKVTQFLTRKNSKRS